MSQFKDFLFRFSNPKEKLLTGIIKLLVDVILIDFRSVKFFILAFTLRTMMMMMIIIIIHPR